MVICCNSDSMWIKRYTFVKVNIALRSMCPMRPSRKKKSQIKIYVEQILKMNFIVNYFYAFQSGIRLKFQSNKLDVFLPWKPSSYHDLQRHLEGASWNILTSILLGKIFKLKRCSIYAQKFQEDFELKKRKSSIVNGFSPQWCSE